MSTPEPPDTTTEEPAPEHEASKPPAAPESAPTPPPEPGREGPVEDRPSTWQPMLYTKIALLLLAVAYSIGFVVQNTDQIKIDFIFATARVHLIWEILLLLAVGLVGGVLLSQLHRHRRRAKLAKESGKAGNSGRNLRH